MGIIKDIDKKAKPERKKRIKALGSGRISEGIDHANKVATLEHMSNVLKTHFGPNFSERRPRSSKSRYVNFTESEKKGCFITSAVCKTLNKPDDCAELTKFRYFRDTFMQASPEMRAEVEEYYVIAPQICDAIV